VSLFELCEGRRWIHLSRKQTRFASTFYFDEIVSDVSVETVRERMSGIGREDQNLFVAFAVIEQV